ncbi:hypothetical protein TNCV_3276661 [Trichonephila clavipes]|nr:hypothetical protein TNCV_3276661 [Trichonephila clavipes]
MYLSYSPCLFRLFVCFRFSSGLDEKGKRRRTAADSVQWFFSPNGNQDSHPTSGVCPPTSNVFETAPMTTSPSQILSTNQETPTHKGPSTSGHIQHFRHGMEERFAFRFPVMPNVQMVF